MTFVAAIDLGTNSTRLLVCDADGRELVRRTQITRLGEGLSGTGRLSSDASARVVDTLRAYQVVLDECGVAPGNVRAIATSAARDASNRDEFFDACAAVLGARPDLLSGEEEGRLAFAGATSTLEPRRSAFGEDELDLILDIGGGSTEFVVGVPGQLPIGAISTDAGCVGFNEKFLDEFDPPGPEALSGAVTVMRAHLEDVDRELPASKKATRLVGLAGSVTAVAMIEIGLHTYDRERLHHFVLTREAAEDVFRTVATEKRVDRAANPGLEPERVDTIVAGALILVSVMRYFDFAECLVSETDILDGVVADLRLRTR